MENKKLSGQEEIFCVKFEKASYIARKIMEEGVMRGLEPYFKIEAIPQELLYRLYASNALALQETIMSILQTQEKITPQSLQQDNQTKCNPKLCPLKASILLKTPKVKKKTSMSFQHHHPSFLKQQSNQIIANRVNAEYFQFSNKGKRRQSSSKLDRRKLVKLNFNRNSNMSEFNRYKSELNSQSGDQTEKMLREAKSHKIDYPTTEKFIREDKKQKKPKETYISTKKKVNYTTDWKGNLIAMEKIPTIANCHQIDVEVVVLNDQCKQNAHCESLNILSEEEFHQKNEKKIKQLTQNQTQSFGLSIMKHMKAPRPLEIKSIPKISKQIDSFSKIDRKGKQNSVESSTNSKKIKQIPSKISFQEFQEIRKQNSKEKVSSFCKVVLDDSFKKIDFIKKEKKHRSSLLNQSDQLKLSDTRQSIKNFQNITLSNVQAFQFLVKESSKSNKRKNVTIDPFFTKQS